ncbi:hypothetical protein VOLCADRAFT_101385, partial [Volvox carteri f. nagariensis]
RTCEAATIAPNGRNGEQADVRRGYHRAQWARWSTGGCAVRLPSRPMGATVNRRMCSVATIAPNGRDGEQADVRMCGAATIVPNGRDGEQADVRHGYHRAQWARRSTGGRVRRLPSRPMGATVNRRMCSAATIAPNGRDGQQADVQRGYHCAQWARRRMCGAATIAPNGRDGKQADVQRGYHRAQWARRSTGGRVRRLPSRPMGATVNRRTCEAATIAPNGRDGKQADVQRGYHRAQWARRRTCEAATIAPNGRNGEQADVRRGYHRAQWARWSTCGCAVRLPSRPMGATVNRRMCGVATIAPNGRDGEQADVRMCGAATIVPNGRDGEQADVRHGYHRAQWVRRSTGGRVRRLPSRPMGATVNRRMCSAATIAPNGRDGQQADVQRGYHRAQWARRRMCGVATIAPNGRDGKQADVQRGYHRAQWARRSTGGRVRRLPSRPMGATVNRQMCGAATIVPNGRDGQQADVQRGYHRAQWARR